MANAKNILGVAGGLLGVLVFTFLSLLAMIVELAFYIALLVVVFGGAAFLLDHFGIVTLLMV